MGEFLLEIGVEELPASMVRSAAEQLVAGLAAAIAESRLDGGEPRWYATPRRLIAVFPAVLERQPQQTVDKRGPASKAAYGADGAPTPALLGFCKSIGVEPDAVEVRDDYVWVTADLPGKFAIEVLSEIAVSAVRKISFEKTMRWGGGRMRFSRPIRWIVALYDGQVVPMTVESVTSCNLSRGHRFLAPEEFEVDSIEGLLKGLRERFVEPDPMQREAIIRGESHKLVGDKAQLTSALVEENVYLTEWPAPITGAFREEFLTLPVPVLVTAMAKHEKFFPVRSETGSISTAFISVTNGGDEDTIRRGNQWVLNARYNDAKFFFDEDKRHTLAEFLEKTERIVFQDRLGTIRQRSDRISALARIIAQSVGLSPEEVGFAELAGLYCKADLSTGLVSELPSLQGQVGGEYAKRDGLPEIVCHAISSHYDPTMRPKTASENVALAVMCADQADRLAGYLGIGESPSGSSDPFALRRAATLLIEAQTSWGRAMPGISDWVLDARKLYEASGINVGSEADILEALREIVVGRYEAMFSGVPYHVREAALATNWTQSSGEFLARARLLANLAEDTEFVRTAKRPANIVSAAKKKGIDLEANEPDPSLFIEQQETTLDSARRAVSEKFSVMNDDEAIDGLKGLKPAIDSFFDTVMVMVDDEVIRNNRLQLLRAVDVLFRRFGDFSKIVIEGE
jgi:glycyl-tRNA synthetase beta chain